MKIHKLDTKPNAYGGYNMNTLCRRMHSKSQDGMNGTSKNSGVTCKFCLKLMKKNKS